MKPEKIQPLLTAAFFAVVVLTVLVHASPTKPLGRDSGSFLYIGRMITQGGLAYRDGWDSKPPAIFYLDAAGLWLGGGTRWGVWVIEFGFLFAAAWLSYHALKELWDGLPALGGTTLWLLGADILFGYDGGNMTEEYPLPLHFLSILLLLKLLKKFDQPWLHFVLGLNFALAFLFRPNNALVEALVIGVLYLAQMRTGLDFGEINPTDTAAKGMPIKLAPSSAAYSTLFAHRWKHLLWLGLGALLPLLFTSLYFAVYGIFDQFLDATLIYNFSYGAVKTAARNPFARTFELLGGLAWLAALGFIIAAWRLYQSIKSRGFDYLYLFLVFGAPLSVVFSDLSRKGFEHYFINVLPLLGLLAGLVIYTVVEVKPLRLKEKHALLLWTAALLAASAYFVFSGRAGQYFLVTDFSGGFFVRNQQLTPISQYVNEHSQPQETVLFWGAFPNENFLASRAAPGGVLFYPILAPSAVSADLNTRFLSDLQMHPPALIVDMLDPYLPALDPVKRAEQSLDLAALPANLAEVFAYVQNHYVFKKTVAGKDVYARVK